MANYSEEDQVYKVKIDNERSQKMSFEQIISDLIYGDDLQGHFDIKELKNGKIRVFDDEGGHTFSFTVTSEDENDMSALKEELYRLYNEHAEQIHEDLPEEERQEYMY